MKDARGTVICRDSPSGGASRRAWEDRWPPSFGSLDEPPAAIALVIETTGGGARYQVKHAEGWWRDFSEVRIDDERTVLRFLQMRGDPLGDLEPGRSAYYHLLEWPDQGAAAGCHGLGAGWRVRNR